MSIALARLWAEIVLHTIATIKEFAYVTANVLLQNKFATWMTELKVFNIDHQIVQDHILGA